MSLIGLILVLVIVGVGLYFINLHVPMDPKIKTILNVVIVIAIVLFLLHAFGLLAGLDNVRIH